jgi:cystathionine beta-lyase
MGNQFNKITNRVGTNCFKYDYRKTKYRLDDILPLSVADMDFKTPTEVIDSLNKTVLHGIFGYTFLTDKYYISVSNWFFKRYNWRVKRENIIFCPRIVQAVSLIIQNFTKENDKVGVFSPGYSPLSNSVRQNNRDLVEIPLILEENHYEIDFDLLKKEIKKGIKLFILINPHNPTGRVWTKEELIKIAKICKEEDVLIISDEIHSDFIKKEYNYTPLASISKDISKKVITCTSPTKTFNLPGIQVSNIIIENESIRDKFKNMVEINGLHEPNSFVEPSVLAAYEYGERWLEELLLYLDENKEFLINFINKNNLPFKVIKGEGTFLVWIDYRQSNLSYQEMWKWIVEEARVGIQFGESFGLGGEGFFRINIASPREILQEGLERILRVRKN